MSSSFFLKRPSGIFGPYSLEQAKVAAATGRLRSADLIAPSRQGPWQPVAENFELSAFLAAEPVSSAAGFSDLAPAAASFQPAAPYQLANGPSRARAKVTAQSTLNLVPILWAAIGALTLGLLVVSGLLIFRSPPQPREAVVSAPASEPDQEAVREVATLKQKLDESQQALQLANDKLSQAEEGATASALRISQLEIELNHVKSGQAEVQEKLQQAERYTEMQKKIAANNARDRAAAAREANSPPARAPSGPQPGSSVRSDPYASATDHLDGQILAAQSRGDLEGMLEYEQVKAALSLLKSGNEQLLSQFSQSTVASAKLLLRRFDQSGPVERSGRGTSANAADPYEQAQDYLDGLALSAQAQGDTEAMMEYSSAKAAISVLVSGDQQLLGVFSPKAIATAKLALRRFQQ